jgi:metal-responsive CopG/Arc/MetJ family transcriptional regulator
MGKTVKFAISLPAAEFKTIETLRRKAGLSRSRFIREAVRRVSTAPAGVREDHAPYAGLEAIGVDDAERRRRAIAAAGQFRSGLSDVSSNHDRYLEEAYSAVGPGEDKKGSG